MQDYQNAFNFKCALCLLCSSLKWRMEKEAILSMKTGFTRSQDCVMVSFNINFNFIHFAHYLSIISIF